MSYILVPKMGVFEVRQFRGVIQIDPQPTPVAIVTRIFAYCYERLASANRRRATITLGFAMPSSKIAPKCYETKILKSNCCT